jgi:NADPH:quinone reductase-like Zn-dependent oxidoreductase
MRAITMTDFDASPSLSDLDLPEPGAGDIRVRVRAASVNGFDLAVAAGQAKAFMEHRFPLVLGKDFAGEVDAVGQGVEGFEVGDRVFGVVTKPFLGDGSFAEYVTVHAEVGIAKLPDGVSFIDAAALGLAGAAAHTAVDGAALQPGETVLVVGATGGVGNQVVQLAAAAGARVLATASTEQGRELVTRLGAAAVVDHTSDLVSQVRELVPDGVDVVMHLAGDFSVLDALREGGRFVSTLVMSAEQVPTQSAIVVPVFANPTGDVLDRAATAQVRGVATVTVQRVFPLEQADEALAAFAAGTLGKIVISID